MTVADLNTQHGLNAHISSATLTRWLIGVAVFAGAFVIHEPAPYEILLAITMPAFLLFGMRLGAHALTLGAMFAVFCLGGALSMLTMDAYKTVPTYLAVTAFLTFSTVFFCAAVEADETRLRTIFRAYTLGAVFTAILGIAGYFKLFSGAEIFTRYDRAMGAFQDPNVFGPYLVLPTLFLMQRILTDRLRSTTLRVAGVCVLLLALLLSFSRAAWGLMIVAVAILYFLNLATAPTAKIRQRLMAIGLASALGLALSLVVALQFDTIAQMFEQRARLVQEYDSAQLGRFARHAIGFAWAMENPLGMGALEFGLKLGEDTHNIWLKALLAYGWLGFAAFVTLAVSTLVLGGRCLGRNRYWQPYLFCAYSAFVGHLLLAWVIDIDHWRHFYLIIGIVWGCIALEAKYQRAK